MGTCDVVDVKGPLSVAELQENAHLTGLEPEDFEDDGTLTYAWVLRNARRLEPPIAYRHPSGAVIWVVLEPEVVKRLDEQRVRA